MLAYFLYNSQPNVTEYIPNTVTNTPYHTAGSSSDVDAFDHILEVTTNQEAVYAYYWMDENNKVSFLKVFYRNVSNSSKFPSSNQVKVTEIFDMTNNDNPAIHPGIPQDNNQLEYDSDWEANQQGKPLLIQSFVMILTIKFTFS